MNLQVVQSERLQNMAFVCGPLCLINLLALVNKKSDNIQPEVNRNVLLKRGKRSEGRLPACNQNVAKMCSSKILKM